jgi:hypothetical protein
MIPMYKKQKTGKMKTAILTLLLAPTARCYAPISLQTAERGGGLPSMVAQERRDVFKTGLVILASIILLGRGTHALADDDDRIYLLNARNMAHLGNGNSSRGSI